MGPITTFIFLGAVAALNAISGAASAEMTQGIAFEKLKSTVINQNEWRLVLDFNIRDLSKESDKLETLYKTVSDQLSELSSTKHDAIFWFKDIDMELEKVRLTLDNYRVDLDNLLELLPKERFKRGLINLGGYAAKYLFGVATTDDIDDTNHKVNVLQDIAGDVIHSKQNQLTLLKDVNKKIGINSKGVLEVMEKLANLTININEISNKTMTHWTDIYDYLLHFLYVGNEVRQLGQVTSEARLRIVEFRQALELIKSRRLSSKLLPPNEFVNILLKIEKLLPIDLRLPVPADAENVFLYYDFCKIQAVSTVFSIRLFITIPLTSTASQFETYKIYLLPIFNPVLKQWISWKLALEYILISSDRQYYLPVSEFDLSRCEENVYFWCPNIANIRRNTEADCYYKLFMGIESANLCNKVIRTNVVSPYWVKKGNDWIYSVAETCKITLKCWHYDLTTNKESSQVTDLEISGTGVLQNASRCEIFGSNFRIFHKIQGNTIYNKNLSMLHIPSFSGILSYTENATLTFNLNVTFDSINLLKDQLGNDTVEISLNKLLYKLRSTDSHIKVNYDYRIEFFVIVILSLSTLVLLVVFVCYRKKVVRGQTQTRSLRHSPLQTPQNVFVSDALRDFMRSSQ